MTIILNNKRIVATNLNPQITINIHNCLHKVAQTDKYKLRILMYNKFIEMSLTTSAHS